MRRDKSVVFPEPVSSCQGEQRERGEERTVCALEMPALAFADGPVDGLEDLGREMRHALRDEG